MLRLTSDRPGALARLTGDRWRRRSVLDDRAVSLLVTGAVVVGLGYLAWSYFGPDLRRYMKIHSM